MRETNNYVNKYVNKAMCDKVYELLMLFVCIIYIEQRVTYSNEQHCRNVGVYEIYNLKISMVYINIQSQLFF